MTRVSVTGERVGHAGDYGPTAHCAFGRHHKCPYNPGGQCHPEITLHTGDTYSCPCPCHLED